MLLLWTAPAVGALEAEAGSNVTPAGWATAADSSGTNPPTGVLSTGALHTCALQPDGSVDCWGWNDDGQAADQPGPYIQVSAGDFHTCALRSNGSVECWGSDGDGESADQPGPYSDVSAGGSFTCALKPDGSVDCWGSNNFGNADNQSGPYTEVSAGVHHTCALRLDGSVDCWGSDEFGQLLGHSGSYTQLSAGDYHTCALRSDGSVDCWGSEDEGRADDQIGPYVQVSAGGSHSCGLRSDGSVDCWGANWAGQAVGQSGPYTQIGAGNVHTCGLRSDGAVDCWGGNAYGQADSQVGPYGPDGHIEIVQLTTPPGLTDSFSYTSTIGTAPTFTITDGMTETIQVSAGTYTITQSAAAGFILSDLSCDGVAVTDVDTATAVITLDQGATATCIFTNAELGPIPAEIVTAGGYHSCALKTDGTVSCWGRNSQQQTTVPADTLFTQISAGGYHTCGLKVDGSVTCWGWNNYGQTAAPSGAFSQVSGGQYVTCGLKTDGTLACWGGDGDGLSTVPSGTFTHVTVGWQHACALGTDQSVVCWGSNTFLQSTAPDGTFVQIGAGLWYNCGLRTNGTVECWGRNDYNQVVDAPAGTYVQLGVGGTHACAMKADGSVSCWGSSTENKLVVPSETFGLIDGGGYHTCSLKTDDTLACWGSNSHGQLNIPTGTFGPYEPVGRVDIVQLVEPSTSGNGFDFSTTLAITPTFSLSHGMTETLYVVPGTLTVTQNAAAGFYLSDLSCDGLAVTDLNAATAAITVTADATTTCTFTNAELPPLPEETLSLGGYHTCGLRSDGTIACWGYDWDGQTTEIPSGIFTQVAAGTEHSCGLRPDGSAECWGLNNRGQASPPSGDFSQLSAGNTHTCGLKSDQTIACWGWNFYGQTAVPPGTYSQVSAGNNHTCALRTDGSIACWGDDEYGQTDAPSGTFVQVSTSYDHACALRADGTAVCWGYETVGQTMPPAGPFIQIVAGFFHSCGVRPTGVVECWGNDNYGQSTDVPPGPFIQVSAGYEHTCGLRPDGSVDCWGANYELQAEDQSGPFGPAGRIDIVQLTVPSSLATTFSFSTTSAITPTFSLSHGMTETLYVAPGTLTVTQSAAAGFSLTDLTCDGDVDSNIVDRTVAITVTDGTEVVCTFTTALDTGMLEVTKIISPTGLTDSFTFTVTDGTALTETFSLTGGMTEMLTLPTGSYTVTEALIDGFELLDVDCGTEERSGRTPNPVSNEIGVTILRDETVTCTFTNSLIEDEDGIDPGTESGAPNGGDGNGDGVPDYLQNNVASTPNGEDGKYVTLAAASSLQLTDIFTDSAPVDPPDRASFPIGIVGFAVENVPVGGTVTVTLHLEGDITASAYYKLVDGVWSAYPHATFVDDKTIILSLTDNGDGDSDPTPGRIVDPGAPALVQSEADVFVSTWSAGRVGGLSYGPDDIAQWDGDGWTKWFTGTLAGLESTGKWKHNINAMWISDTESVEFAVSFTQNQQQIDGLGWVDGYDVLWWDGTAFSRWFEGERVGLNNKTQEKIDGLHVLSTAPEWSEYAGDDCEAYMLISTQGPGLVPKPGNVKPKNVLKFSGEDVLGFCATNLGTTTTGFWEMVLDGSVYKVLKNNIESLAANDDASVLYLTSQKQFRIHEAFGGHSMVFAFDMDSERFSGPYARFMDDLGIQPKVDALHVTGELQLP